MNYQEAEVYKNKHLDLIYTDSVLAKFPYKIRYILIAPKDLTITERIDLLKESLHSGKGNKGALYTLKMLNKVLDVYLVAEPTINEYHFMFLENYLSETTIP